MLCPRRLAYLTLSQPCPPQRASQETSEEATGSFMAQLWKSEPALLPSFTGYTNIPDPMREKSTQGVPGSLGAILGAD